MYVVKRSGRRPGNKASKKEGLDTCQVFSIICITNSLIVDPVAACLLQGNCSGWFRTKCVYRCNGYECDDPCAWCVSTVAWSESDSFSVLIVSSSIQGKYHRMRAFSRTLMASL